MHADVAAVRAAGTGDCDRFTDLLAAVDIKDPGCVVPVHNDDAAPVWAQCQLAYGVGLLGKHADRLPGGGVPHPESIDQLLVVWPPSCVDGGHPGAVGTHHRVARQLGLELPNYGAGVEIPQPDHASRVLGDQALSVGAEPDDPQTRLGRAGQFGYLLSGGGIPDADNRLLFAAGDEAFAIRGDFRRDEAAGGADGFLQDGSVLEPGEHSAACGHRSQACGHGQFL